MEEFRIDLWTDGSYNMVTNTFGSAFIADMYIRHEADEPWKSIPDGMYEYEGFSVDETQMQSCAGEIAAALKAIEFAVEAKDSGLNVTKVRIFHDHIGLSHWVSGVYRTTKKYTKCYRELVQDAQKKMGVRFEFIHVKSHSNVELNERVDRMAKRACGVVG